MDFIFAKAEETDAGNLLQGDLLVRNSYLKEVLSHAHKYYAEAPDYTHFLVLTQSCDLVRRGKKKPRSRYITLAAARPVSVLIDRFVERYRFNYDFPVALCEKSRELEGKQLLERLIHNTEDGFFFIKRDSHSELGDDLCVFLALSVAVRAEHYDACLKAKIAQMDHIFAAKVGWLAGSLYSRIATPDVEEKFTDAEKYKADFYEAALFGRTAWLSSAQFKSLKAVVQDWKKANPGGEVDSAVARALLEKVPTDIALIANRIVFLLRNGNLFIDDPKAESAAHNILMSDVYLEKLIAKQG